MDFDLHIALRYEWMLFSAAASWWQQCKATFLNVYQRLHFPMFCVRAFQILSQTSWAAVPDKKHCPSQNKQSFCSEVQALSPCRRWTPVLNVNAPLCSQRVYSVTRAHTIIFWGWIIDSSDLCLRGWRAAALTEPPVHYKETFIWQVRNLHLRNHFPVQ